MSSQSSYTSLEFSHVFLSYSVCITEFLLGKFKLLESTPSIIPSNTWIRVQGWFQMEQICPKLNAFLSYTLLWVVFRSCLVLLLLKINPHFDGFYLYNNCKSSLLFFFFKLIIFREPVFSIENFFWSSFSLSPSQDKITLFQFSWRLFCCYCCWIGRYGETQGGESPFSWHSSWGLFKEFRIWNRVLQSQHFRIGNTERSKTTCFFFMVVVWISSFIQKQQIKKISQQVFQQHQRERGTNFWPAKSSYGWCWFELFQASMEEFHPLRPPDCNQQLLQRLVRTSSIKVFIFYSNLQLFQRKIRDCRVFDWKGWICSSVQRLFAIWTACCYKAADTRTHWGKNWRFFIWAWNNGSCQPSQYC